MNWVMLAAYTVLGTVTLAGILKHLLTRDGSWGMMIKTYRKNHKLGIVGFPISCLLTITTWPFVLIEMLWRMPVEQRSYSATHRKSRRK